MSYTTFLPPTSNSCNLATLPTPSSFTVFFARLQFRKVASVSQGAKLGVASSKNRPPRCPSKRAGF